MKATAKLAVGILTLSTVLVPAKAQNMPKPGGGRCVTYAEQKCGEGGFKATGSCRQAALKECLQQTKK